MNISIYKYNNASQLNIPRKERTQLKAAFTSPGNAGDVTGCIEAMSLLRSSMSFIGNVTESGFQCNIVPSFFRLIASLHRRNVDFKIVFRTFGMDIPNIATEFNLFCTGEHPLSSQFSVDGAKFVLDGSDGGADRRLCLPHCYAQLIRSDDALSAEAADFNAPISGLHMCAKIGDDMVRFILCMYETLTSKL